MIVIIRVRIDDTTNAYVERRTAEGRSKLEIMRCLKRYVAREIYHLIKQRNTEINKLPHAARQTEGRRRQPVHPPGVQFSTKLVEHGVMGSIGRVGTAFSTEPSAIQFAVPMSVPSRPATCLG